MDLEYKKKLAEIKAQRELQIESIATPSVETLIKQQNAKQDDQKKISSEWDVAIRAIDANKELYEMSSKELEEKAKAELKSSSTSGCGAFAAALHGMTLDGLVFTPRFHAPL